MLPLDQIDVFGAYVSPLVVVMLGCAAVWLLLRQLADALGLLPYIWHPALFFTAIYLIMLGGIGLLVSSGILWPA